MSERSGGAPGAPRGHLVVRLEPVVVRVARSQLRPRAALYGDGKHCRACLTE